MYPLSGTAPIDLGSRDVALSQRLPAHLVDRIYQDIGTATMAWENIGGAGVFKSEQAARVAEQLGHVIADELDERDLVLAPHISNIAYNVGRLKGQLDLSQAAMVRIADIEAALRNLQDILKRRKHPA